MKYIECVGPEMVDIKISGYPVSIQLVAPLWWTPFRWRFMWTSLKGLPIETHGQVWQHLNPEKLGMCVCVCVLICTYILCICLFVFTCFYFFFFFFFFFRGGGGLEYHQCKARKLMPHEQKSICRLKGNPKTKTGWET